MEDYTSYQVHGSQLRYAKAMLDANGIPVSAINRQGDTYIIVIPAMYAGFDHHTAPHPRRKPWWLPNRKGIVTLAMLAVVGLGVYMVFSGGITIKGVDVPAVNLPPVSAPVAEVTHAAESAKGAALTFVWAVGALVVGGALWFLRGPLTAAVRMVGKVVHRG